MRFEERTGLRPRRSQVVPARAEKKGENEVTSEGAPRLAEPKKARRLVRSARAAGGILPGVYQHPAFVSFVETNRLRRLLGVLGVGNTRLVRVPRVVFPHRPDGAAERDDEGKAPRRRPAPPPTRRRPRRSRKAAAAESPSKRFGFFLGFLDELASKTRLGRRDVGGDDEVLRAAPRQPVLR